MVFTYSAVNEIKNILNNSLQCFLSVHSAEDLEGGLNYFAKKCFEMSQPACLEGKRILYLPVWSRSHGWEWQKQKLKWRPVSGSHRGESGCWFMAAAVSHHYPCLGSPVTQRTEKGHGTGQLLASLHLTLTPPEPAFLYGSWKIPRTSHACP